MSLREELISISNKPYQPIFSGKLNTAYEKKRESDRTRPQTCPKVLNGTTNTTTTSVANTQFTSRATTATGFRHNTPQHTHNAHMSSRRNDFLKQATQQNAEYEQDSLDGTNISLFSTESDRTLPVMKSYGNFDYFSYFERYMNRRAVVKIPINYLPK